MTLDGTTYAFGDTGFAAQPCEPDWFGVLLLVLREVDGDRAALPNGATLELTLLQEGTDPDVVGVDPVGRLTVGDETWTADEAEAAELGLEPGTSWVDEATMSSARASGSASLHEESRWFAVRGGPADEVPTATGTFDAVCDG